MPFIFRTDFWLKWIYRIAVAIGFLVWVIDAKLWYDVADWERPGNEAINSFPLRHFAEQYTYFAFAYTVGLICFSGVLLMRSWLKTKRQS